METIERDACFRAFNYLCENLSNSEQPISKELNYRMFECGYMAAQEEFANMQKIDAEFLDAVWATQPSLEQDFALK